jgi:hypothetical protein
MRRKREDADGYDGIGWSQMVEDEIYDDLYGGVDPGANTAPGFSLANQVENKYKYVDPGQKQRQALAWREVGTNRETLIRGKNNARLQPGEQGREQIQIR